MRTWSIAAVIAAIAFALPLPTARGQPGDDSAPPSLLAFRVGKVVTMDDADRVVNRATVIVRDGRIEAVGRAGEVAIPEGAVVVERPELWLVPGFVDAHNHTAGGSPDLHDYVYLTNPGYRTLESVVAESPDIERARAGGVTTVLLIPGSGNNMSGFGTLVRTGGGKVEEAVVRRYGSIKIAQAGNPEGYFFGGRATGRSFMNFNTRRTMDRAREYHEAWRAFEEGRAGRPEVDPIFEGFRGLFAGEFVASVHTQGYQVMLATLELLVERLGVRTVLDHCCFDGYKLARLFKDDETVFAINGPRALQYDRVQRRVFGTAARWWHGGVRRLGINTDAPVIPQEELSFQAALGCTYGWMPYEALKGITRVPAEALLLDDLGSIAPGKEASFGLWTGDPIDPRNSCELTVVRGRIVYDAGVKRVF